MKLILFLVALLAGARALASRPDWEIYKTCSNLEVKSSETSVRSYISIAIPNYSNAPNIEINRVFDVQKTNIDYLIHVVDSEMKVRDFRIPIKNVQDGDPILLSGLSVPATGSRPDFPVAIKIANGRVNIVDDRNVAAEGKVAESVGRERPLKSSDILYKLYRDGKGQENCEKLKKYLPDVEGTDTKDLGSPGARQG